MCGYMTSLNLNRIHIFNNNRLIKLTVMDNNKWEI